ncbi:S41 family peptidase [Clostridium sp. LBM24168]
MKRKILISISLFVIILLSVVIIYNFKSSHLSQREKISDFNYMYSILEKNYPYFEVNKRQNRIDWLSNKEEYIHRIKSTRNDEEYFNVLQGILKELNNGHTHMMDEEFYFYCKNIYEKHPQFCKSWIKQLNSPPSIKRYKSIKKSSNTRTTNDYVIPGNVNAEMIDGGKIAYLFISSFNSLNIKENMKTIIPFLKNITDTKALIIDIRGNSGGDSTYWSDNIIPILISKPIYSKEYTAYRGGQFSESFIKERNGSGYTKLKSISSIYKENLTKLPPELKKDFKYYDKNISCIKPKDSINYRGKIFLLVDKNVFSSSEKFAAFSKSTGFAVLVGERTEGDGIGNDPAVCSLPESGYEFVFPKEMGLNSDGSCNFENGTEPDIEISAEKNEDISKDKAIQSVIKYVNQI